MDRCHCADAERWWRTKPRGHGAYCAKAPKPPQDATYLHIPKRKP